MNRVTMERIVSLALLYRYIVDNDNVLISYKNIIEYKKRVEMNLEIIKSNYIDKKIDNDKLIYFIGNDENNNTHFILKPDNDYFKIINEYILKMPDDLVISTQDETNLNVIGLSKENDKIIAKKKTNRLLNDRIL